ncbi:MAG: ribonuclease R [Phycisphaerae bacterium]
MSERFSERILKYLGKPGYEPVRARKLARSLGIAEAEYGDFHEAVDALRRVGRVVLGTHNALMLPHPPGEVTGTYRANPRGFGFVVPDGPTSHGDLYIAKGHALDAVTGDTVQCRVMRRGKRDGKQLFGGRIIRVIERGNSRFVGQLRLEGKVWYVHPDGHTLHVPILIGDPRAKSARAGDQVVVEITRYPGDGVTAKGVIVERLGPFGKPGVDLLSIVRQHGLPDRFPEAVLKEARQAVRSFSASAAPADREDLAGRTIITIDPDDARDFDDAISLDPVAPSPRKGGAARGRRKVRQAVWELGVHIADVSAFVTPGSALDQEAERRGTSVYFPGHVIPMLPEVLSNGVCSLQEGEPRLCKSVFICYDAGGRVCSTRFANTVIRSAKRLTYRQATSVLTRRSARLPAGCGGKRVAELLKKMEALARAIRARRLAEGMIVLDLPAVELVLDDDGRVVDARPEDTSFTHTIIEMFMVEANEAVARLFHRLEVPFLRRIHPPPDEEALEAMARFLQVGGEKMPRRVTPQALERLLDRLRGKPEGYAVNLAVLKSMQMAEYSPEPIGHFALASDHYTHFTSPIRRYPDLMIHRLLDAYLRGGLGAGKKSARRAGRTALVAAGKQMSYLSRRAESAERELKSLKVLTLLRDRVGEEFDGVVTGVTNFGLFVQHPKYLIDGLLRLEDLGDDWWEVDVRVGRVVGERSRRSFAIGSAVRVRIAGVDLPARQLDLALTSERGRRGGRGRASAAAQRKPRAKRGKPSRGGGRRRR